MSNGYDIIVIGAGPGGYIAAIRAAQLGFKAAIVEREHLGGICLNWGCIPTKSLLTSAEVFHAATHAASYGLRLEGKMIADVGAIVERSRSISARLNNGIGFLMKKHKVDILWGEAKIGEAPKGGKPGKVIVGKPSVPSTRTQTPPPGNVKGEGVYEAKHIILATGARPRAIPGMEPDGRLIWTSYEAMTPKTLPKSLLVMGSGAIGVEFAGFYKALGSDVTLLELLPSILPMEDAEISGIARQQFEKQGLKILTETKVVGVEKQADSLTVRIQGKDGQTKTLTADRMISAVGVQCNTENLGLESLGVKLERGAIVTDGFGKTNVPGIYAIGDIAGAPMLAHKAEHEAVLCIEKIANLPGLHPLERNRVPSCTYCTPQVASVGLTEAKAKELGLNVRVGKFPFKANGKALVLGESEGLVKTIFDKETGELLGAHMVGPGVTELIHGFVEAMNLEATEEDLIHTIFPHPTLSEAMKESVLDAYGRVLNA